jgi:ABC-type molybdate transport system substrate-binding protein
VSEHRSERRRARSGASAHCQVHGAVKVLIIVAALLALAGCGSGSSSDAELTGTVTVLADDSLTDVFTDLGRQLEDEHPGLTVDLQFGDSATQATGLADGASADVFASAGTDPMDVVTNDGIVSRAPTLFATATSPDDGALVGYPICTLTDAPNPAAALAFVQRVTSDDGRDALRAAGFELP